MLAPEPSSSPRGHRGRSMAAHASESPVSGARPEDREFPSRPRQQRPESRRPERPPRQEFGSARERPSRPERAHAAALIAERPGRGHSTSARGPSGGGAADRAGSTGARPFDKTRGSKGPARGEKKPSRPASGPPARRAGSTDREFFSRPRQDRRPERTSRKEFDSTRERPSRPERAHSGPDRRGLHRGETLREAARLQERRQVYDRRSQTISDSGSFPAE